MKLWSFKVIVVEHKGKYEEYSSDEISCMILNNLKESAEAFLATEVVDAVITVIAYFSDKQRHTIKDVGTLAALNVMRLISKPTTANFIFWATEINENKKVHQVSVDSKGFFEVRFVEVLAMKNSLTVLRRSRDSGIVSGFCRGKDEGFAGTAGISYSIGGVTCSHDSKSQSEHIDEFHKLVGDLAAIDTAISDKDQALLLLTSLPSSYDNFMTEAKGGGGEGFYVRGRSGQRDMEQGIVTRNLKVVLGMKIMYPVLELMGGLIPYNIRDRLLGLFKEYDGGNILLGGDGREFLVRGAGKVQVHMRDGSSFVLDNVRYIPELRRNLISLGTLEKEGFTVKMQTGKIKVVTRKTLKGRKQLGEYQIRWKIKTDEGGSRLLCDHQRLTTRHHAATTEAASHCRTLAQAAATVAAADCACMHGLNVRGVGVGCYPTSNRFGRYGAANDKATKEAIWLKGLAIESGFELKIVAGIATGVLSKAIPDPRFQHKSKLLRIGID
ncbi:zinc finger, CCHC-type containing protein [Tanacetum coccineum]